YFQDLPLGHTVLCSGKDGVLPGLLSAKRPLLYLASPNSFLVIGPSEPIVAVLGADTVLPCRVSPAMSVENMEIRLFHSQFSDAVYVYQNGMEQAGEQLVDFKGRAELVKDYITEGRVAVRMTASGSQTMECTNVFFKKEVISLGSGTHIFMVGPEDEGIRLKCTGKGWFPQPEIQWEDAKGEKIPSLAEDKTQDNDGLFQFEASLLVRDRSKTEVSCSMKNPFFGQEQVAFVVTLVILGAFTGAVVYLAQNERQKKKKLSEVKKEKEKESKAKARRKKLYQQDWRKAELYAVVFTLDPATALPNLILSESRKHIYSKESVSQNGDAPTHQEQGESEAIFSVLGKIFLTVERQYWEVERKPLSLRQHSCKIGVFLDWDAGNVSFYSMIDGSHIYPFTGITFCGTLHPYFSLQGAGASLTICAASDHTENCPDSSPKTSLTHLSNCDTSVPQETLYYHHKK
ncbi:hypothetical protein EI555_002545, partial [Monodon monoceros]